MLSKDELKTRLRLIKDKVNSAAIKAGRDPQQVQLLAVSKTHPASLIQWAYEEGHIDFGENYVQEASEKQKSLAGLPLRWHFIGHLQKNKVKNVVGQFDLIHSVDSFALAQKISSQAQTLKIEQKILLEINLAGEESKGGFSSENLNAQWNELLSLPSLRLCGLMALPPLSSKAEESRPYFRKLSDIFLQFKNTMDSQRAEDWRFLSMGTTHDFEIAIEEGAHIVRVGTAIFGQRT